MVIDKSRRDIALDSMKHRGPDAEGTWLSQSRKVWLGHRRLAILDLSESGNQPMCNEDCSIWIVCNGEIYNYLSLRSWLESKGHYFKSRSDNEVIIHAYEEWGEHCVEHLEGMFAFALWDEKQQKLIAARDRVGIKPLYYLENKDGIVLASELRGLLPILRFRPEPDPMALAYIMTLGYVPCPFSIWKGIFKLEPGHLIEWRLEHGMLIRRYWEPPRHIEISSDKGAEKWQSLFEVILNEHLLSDVPIGLFLSGGLDSSTVAAVLHDLDKKLHTITVAFPGSQYDEASIAESVSKKLGFSFEKVDLKIEGINDLIVNTVQAFDEPQGYSALISMYLACKTAASEFKVVLSGDGGDEIFGGYGWYKNLGSNLPWYYSWMLHTMRPLTKRITNPTVKSLILRHFSLLSSLHRHAMRLYPRFLPEEVELLMKPFGLKFGDDEMLEPFRKHFEPTLPLQRALQRIDLMTFCSDSILAKVDRASMAHSLEVRVPFLDRRIIEWALVRQVENREKIESKPILRDYLHSRVPSSVLKHPKQGFSLRMLNDFDWKLAIDFIQQGHWVRQGYWSDRWKLLVEANVPFREARIWNLLILTHWAGVWLK